MQAMVAHFTLHNVAAPQKHTVIPNKRLTHKQHEIWVVLVDKHRECVHERFVVLHTACGVHKDDVDAVARRLLNGQGSNVCGVLVVAAVKEGYSEAVAVCLELFHSPRSTHQVMGMALTGMSTEESCLETCTMTDMSLRTEFHKLTVHGPTCHGWLAIDTA